MIAPLLLSAALLTGAMSGSPAAKDARLENNPGHITRTAPEQAANGAPAPTFMTCTAQLDCPAPFTSGPAVCTGNTTCLVHSPDGVSCDGTFVPCSCDGLLPSCSDPYGYCSCRASGGLRCFKLCEL
jgi:hypothetical protein